MKPLRYFTTWELIRAAALAASPALPTAVEGLINADLYRDQVGGWGVAGALARFLDPGSS